MAEKKETRTPKRRTQVKELVRKEKELSKDEQKKIKGGPTAANWLPAMRSDGTGGNNT